MKSLTRSYDFTAGAMRDEVGTNGGRDANGWDLSNQS